MLKSLQYKKVYYLQYKKVYYLEHMYNKNTVYAVRKVFKVCVFLNYVR